MRVLSLHPSATELVFAIGAGGNLVGRTDLCTFPESALKVPTLGLADDATLEKVLIFEPDLVITGKGQKRLAEKLASQVQVLHLEPESVESLFQQILTLAEILDKQVEADVLVHDLMSTLEKIRTKAKKFKKTRVYFEDSNLKVANGYIADIVSLSAGTPFSGDLTHDAIVEFDPQVIITLASEDSVELIKHRAGWNELNAIKFDRVFHLDRELLTPGPRLVEGISKISRILHGIDAS